MVGTLDPIDVLVSDYAIHNYGIYLGSNQYQLQSGALIIRQPAPMSITGKYSVNIQIKSISGFDGAGTKLVAISLGTTSGNTRSIGNPLYFTSDGETLTIQGDYSIPVESWCEEYTYLTITVMNNTNDNPEVIEIYDGTITISDPVFSQTIQYSDGRQEIINVPKAFSVGDVVAVTHRRDGGVVVQRVSSVFEPTGIFAMYSATGTPISGGTVRVKGTFTKYAAGVGASWCEISIRGYGAVPDMQEVIQKMASLEIDVPTTLETDDCTFEDPTTIWAFIYAYNGCFITVDNVQYSIDSGETWLNVADGDFSKGEFKLDIYEGWVIYEQYGEISGEMVEGHFRTIEIV